MIFTVSYGAYLANAIDRGIALQFSENQPATVDQINLEEFCRTFNSFCMNGMGELLAKNLGRTTRIQFDGQHPLFGEHLQNETILHLLNLPINRQLKMNLTSMEVSMTFSLFLN